MRLITAQVRNSSRQTASPEAEIQPFVTEQDLQQQQPTLLRTSSITAQDITPAIPSIQNTQDNYPARSRSISPVAGPSAMYAQVVRSLPTRNASSDSDDQLDFRPARSVPVDGDDEDDDTDYEDVRAGKANGPLRDYSGMNPASFGAGGVGARSLESPQSSVVSSPGGFGAGPRTKNRDGRPMSPETDF